MARQKVLIIDDDKDIADLHSIVLSMVGYDCEIVHTAREGLAKLALYIPDIVLLDLQLGVELGGVDILYQIRTNPRLDNTRVIVITGYSNLAAQIDDLTDLTLLKPVDIDQLTTLVQRVANSEMKPKTKYFRDPVTGLFNQEFFQTRLEHAFERKRRLPEFLYGVVIFSFESTASADNDMQEDYLTNLMQAVGSSLLKNFRPTETIARISTTGFASLHEDLKRPEDLQVIVDRLKMALLRIFQAIEKTNRPELWLGAALCEPDFQKPGRILEAAEKNRHLIPYLEA